jgi:hypothetical protein
MVENTWGKPKAQNQAAPDIEKGTRKVKVEEDTEQTVEAAARSHTRGCTGKAENTPTGGTAAAAAATKAHQLTAATPASEEPDAAGRNRETAVKKGA